jgi:hypothetical protein
MCQIPTKKWNCEIRDKNQRGNKDSIFSANRYGHMGKKQKNLGTGVTHKENRRKNEKEEKNRWKL